MQTNRGLQASESEKYIGILTDLLQLLGCDRCELGAAISSAVRLLQNSEIVRESVCSKTADERLIELIEQTADGFERGIKTNYMNGLQEMLRVVRDGQAVLENPHQLVCRLLDLIIGPSVVGLESHVKAGIAEVAAKVVTKLLANNKEKQILTSEE